MTQIRLVFATGACALLAWSGTAFGQAGGLSLPEDGGPSNGTAGAGAGSIARDAQTAWNNHAGMTRLDGVEILLSVQPFFLDLGFNPGGGTTSTGSDGGNQGGWLPNGALFLAAPIGDRFAIGFSVTAPTGLGLNPDDDWVGRYAVTETTLAIANLEPSVAFRINEQWSIGAGIDIQYATFEQKLAVARPGPLRDGEASIDGDSWDVGFSASVLWEPLETTRFGLRYRSEVSHELSGDLVAFLSPPISAGLTSPQNLTISGYHELNDQWALMGDVTWTDWSAFDRVTLTIDGLGGTQFETPTNFNDTWSFSLGAHYRPADRWLLMFGGAYTTSAVDDADRTPALPTDQQVRVSIGLEYEIGESWRVGGNYTYAWLGDNDIDQRLPGLGGRIQGDYDTGAHFLGIYASYRF